MKLNLIFSVLVISFSYGSAAFAQGTLPSHYIPVRPTISPYFAYSAINTTGLPNYYTYIQPLQQQALIGQRVQQQIRASSSTADNRVTLNERTFGEMLDRHLQQRLTTGGGAPATAATYQNYSHYYQRPGSGRR